MGKNDVRNYYNELVEAIASVDDPEKLARFFDELFTPAERARFALRWELMVLLAHGYTQREVADRLGVSLCKVTRGAKILKNPSSVTWELLERMEEAHAKKNPAQ